MSYVRTCLPFHETEFVEQNAAAYASGAFSLMLKSSDSYTVSGTPTLVIGGGDVRPVSFLQSV